MNGSCFVYKNVWDAYLINQFMTKHQRCNPHKYTIASLPKSLDHLLATFRESERSKNVSSEAEVVCQGHVQLTLQLNVQLMLQQYRNVLNPNGTYQYYKTDMPEGT